MKTRYDLEVAGTRFAVFEYGQGEPMVVAHCSGSQHRQWRHLVKRLSHQYRLICPDLHGYGQSEAFQQPSSGENLDLQLLRTLINQQDQPCHVLGHSYGGAMALQAVCGLPEKVASLTLIEPVVFNVLKNDIDFYHWQQVCDVAQTIQDLVKQDKCKDAARVFVRFWHSLFGWYLMPGKHKQGLAKLMPKIAYEFKDIFLAFPVDEVQRLSMPIHLVQGSATKSVAKAVLALLHEYLPQAHFSEIKKAGHMSPITHPYQTVDCLDSWYQKSQQQDGSHWGQLKRAWA